MSEFVVELPQNGHPAFVGVDRFREAEAAGLEAADEFGQLDEACFKGGRLG
jgi:hypothetical protein